MLELIDARKSYTTGDFTQVALDDVSITFRDNEFVAILGPSGSGKTTLLNIIGGLDHYDSGNLIIDGNSTDEYTDRDWDAYRNNRIGFVFQSYNLIPHQTVLANVELALTLAGVSRAERRERATAALTEVGLADHLHKRPNQLSGGQMQRVAIARALVNDPEILLADEPTGALDSTTSVQIMGLLTSIAKDRLVIMVTHNPELAAQYANRIVELRDGRVSSDSRPVVPGAEPQKVGEPSRRTAMSFLTAIALSFSNLMTKKGRTLMTSFAGSIGIIGIALILALANGVNEYIKGVEEDTLSMYPLTIQRQGFDMTAMMAASTGFMEEASGANQREDGRVYEVPLMSGMLTSVGTNDLASLKTWLEDPDPGSGGNASMEPLVNAIEYSYDVTPQIFASDYSEGPRQVNPDASLSALGVNVAGGGAMAMGMRNSVFLPLVADISLVENHYDVVAGRWPTNHNESILVVTSGGGISDLAFYAMGLRDPAELDAMIRQFMAEEEVTVPSDARSYTYDEVMDVTFKVVPASDFYTFDDEFDVWTDRRSDKQYMTQVVSKGEELRIVGIVKPNGDGGPLQPGILYHHSLTQHVMDEAAASPIVRQQLASPSRNVITGRTFGEVEPTNQLDFSTLFEIDQEAIARAFTFDTSTINIDTSALNIQMPDIALDPSKMPALDLSTLMAGINLADYIRAPEPGQGPVLELPEIDPDVLAQLAPEFVEAYLAFAVANEADPADIATVLPEFLAAEETQTMLDEAAKEFGIDIDVYTQALSDYLAWAADRGRDPTDIQGNLETYFAEQQQNLLAGAISLIDTEALGRALEPRLAGYMQQVMGAYMGDVSSQIGGALQAQIGGAMQTMMNDLMLQLPAAMTINEAVFMDAFKLTRTPQELTQLLMSMAAFEMATYDTNLRDLGYASLDDPSRIDIYPKDFESKEQVTTLLDGYNEELKAAGDDAKVITYTDFVGALMSSVTDIINMITYVLIAFVAISLVVSSIMIGVITYISVLERKKEIGILRSVGASKRDIRRVFNAETLIVGFIAGTMGVIITFLITIPANFIVESKFDVPNIAVLPLGAAVILVAISMGLTSLAGLLPASSASRKDPVEALRSE